MRKSIFIISIFALMLSLLPISVFGEDVTAFVVSPCQSEEGEINVEVAIQNNKGFAAGKLEIVYPQESLTLVEAEFAENFASAFTNINSEIVTFVCTKDIEAEGVFLRVKFTVNENPEDQADVGIICHELYNSKEEMVDASTENCKISLSSGNNIPTTPTSPEASHTPSKETPPSNEAAQDSLQTDADQIQSAITEEIEKVVGKIKDLNIGEFVKENKTVVISCGAVLLVLIIVMRSKSKRRR